SRGCAAAPAGASSMRAGSAPRKSRRPPFAKYRMAPEPRPLRLFARVGGANAAIHGAIADRKWRRPGCSRPPNHTVFIPALVVGIQRAERRRAQMDGSREELPG